MRRGIIAVLGLLAGCDNVFQLRHLPEVNDATHVDAARFDARTADAESFDTDATSDGGPYFVQATTQSAVSASLSFASFAAATTPGCLIVVFVGQHDQTPIASVTDSAGDMFFNVGGTTFANGVGQSAYYAQNCGAASTITVIWQNMTAGNVDIRALEYGGAATLNAYGAALSTGGISMTPTTPQIQTESAHNLIVAGFVVSKTVTAPGSGYTIRVTSTSGGVVEDAVETFAGNYDASVTQSQSAAFAAHIIAFTPP